MSRFDRHYFAGRYAAQEARKEARAGDFDYASQEGRSRFQSAAVVDTDSMPSAPAARGAHADHTAAQLGTNLLGKADAGDYAGADASPSLPPDAASTETFTDGGVESRHASIHGNELGSAACGDGNRGRHVGGGTENIANKRGAGAIPADVERCCSSRSAQAGVAPGPSTHLRPQQAPLFGARRLQFILPMPPSVNELYGVGRGGQKFLLPEQRQFRSRVIGIVHGHMRRTEQRAQPLTGRLSLSVTWYFRNFRRTDISNRWKALEDALTHAGAYVDDSQIDRQLGERAINPNQAEEECLVTLQEIGA